MDDTLELPTSISAPRPDNSEEGPNEDLSSGDEDEGLDWTKLPTVSRPVIPKRGEKDFEPIAAGGSGYQKHVLDRSRNAMLDALRAERNTSSKSISYGIWYPGIARTHVTTVRGIHFASMGHSVARASEAPTSEELKELKKIPKRLELLPEEALYLIERGAMFCWKTVDPALLAGMGGVEMEGAPMTVQQAFAEMIGQEDLTMDKYHVFAYFKRLGYVVTRTRPPSQDYPLAAPCDVRQKPHLSLFRRLYLRMTSLTSSVFGLFTKLSWWRPLAHSRWLHHNMTYPSVFKSLRFLPSGHSTPLNTKTSTTKETSPYKIVFNVYKPSTPFKKSAPPAPDFSVVVVDARTTPMPTLSELSNLFDILPELPPPVPRKRQAFSEIRAAANASKLAPPLALTQSSPPEQEVRLSFLQRILPWKTSSPPPPGRKPNQPNPFAMLKAGKKMVVIAAVDAGIISFFSFRQGAFEEFPMA